MDETVQVTCPRCKARFREKARKIVDGFSRQCPTCESVVFFMDDSFKPEIKLAMKTASAVRRAVRIEAEDKIFNLGRAFASRRSQLAVTSEES